MEINQNEIRVELQTRRDEIKKFVQPYWERYIRYQLTFCMVLFYGKNVLTEEYKQRIRTTDGYLKLDNMLTCLIFESLELDTAVTVTEKIFYQKEKQFELTKKEFYSSLICSSQIKDEEELINRSFMILEYANEYKRKNEILDFGVIPSKYCR